MALGDLFEFADLFMSWRLYVGLGLTAAACTGISHISPNDTLTWIICVPVGITGLLASFWWQNKADLDS